MEQYLVVSILGPNNIGVLNSVSAHIKKQHCWIVRAHVMVLGTAFACCCKLMENGTTSLNWKPV